MGRYDESEIAAEYERARTASGERHAATAHASRLTEEAKAEAWVQVVESDKLPNAVQEAVIGGFVQTDQRELLASYTERYFEVVKDNWESRGSTTAEQIVIGLFPTAQTMPSTVTATDRWLEHTTRGRCGPGALIGLGAAQPLRQCDRVNAEVGGDGPSPVMVDTRSLITRRV